MGPPPRRRPPSDGRVDELEAGATRALAERFTRVTVALGPQQVFGDWPMFGLVDDVRPALRQAVDGRRAVALATVCGARGGAPFGVGAQMLLGPETAAGFLSGGCVEADVALHAAEALADGRPRRLVYGEGGVPDIRLPCGGAVVIAVEPLAPNDPAARRLLALTDERSPALWLSDGERRHCLAPGDATPSAWRALVDGAGERCVMDAERLFYARRYDPAQRLLVIGSDPIALAVASLGVQMGWNATLSRARGPAAAPPIPGLGYLATDPADGLVALRPDRWTAVVVATHGAEDDHAAVKAALRSDAGYVGLLGSRRRLADRLERLRDDGVGASELKRVRAPVGLPIHARSPREIAVAVVGEIIDVRHAHERAAGLWRSAAEVAVA